MEECGLKWWVRTAAALAGTAFIALVVTIPVLINDVTIMEEELALQRVEYMEMSNVMWDELMTQNKEIKYVRATRDAQRHRRQYDTSDSAKPAGGDYSGVSGDSTKPRGHDQPRKPLVCPPGPPGPRGAAGDNGENGEDGIPGLPGNNGGEGANSGSFAPSDNPYETSAVAGSTCAPCPAGPPGLPGYKGKRGQRGEKGAKGMPGNAGRDGEIGEEGPEGELGYQGDLGQPGEKGAPGEDGIGYAKGAPGAKGETGPPGMEGDEGMPGERGDDAAPGPQGETGPQGPPGEHGKDGVPGFPGKAGGHGADAEYCPCPERTKGKGEDDNRGHGGNSYEASNGPGSGGAPQHTMPPSQEPVAPTGKYTESNGVYDKRARAAALRRRH